MRLFSENEKSPAPRLHQSSAKASDWPDELGKRTAQFQVNNRNYDSNRYKSTRWNGPRIAVLGARDSGQRDSGVWYR